MYAPKYVQRALFNEAQLEAPDKSQSGEYHEILVSVYEGRLNGGTQGARQVWDTVRRLRPDVRGWDKVKLIHADQLKTLPIPSYLLEEYAIYRGCLHLLYGKSGTGKSFIGIDIAGKIGRFANVVYVAGEGRQGYITRWEAWKVYNQVFNSQVWFYHESLQLMDTEQVEIFIELIKPLNPMLIVIDTLARSAVGVDENSNTEMGKLIRACDYIIEQFDEGHCSMLLVHHTSKNGDIRGATAVYNAVDSALKITKQDGRLALENDDEYGGKNKYKRPLEPRYLKIVPYPVPSYEDGAVLMPAEDVVQPKGSPLTPIQKRILESLEGYEQGLTGQQIIDATAIKKGTVYYNLKQLIKLECVKEGELGRNIITDKGKDELFKGE